MIVRAQSGLHRPGDQGRTARRTDRGRHVRVQEQDTRISHPIQIGRGIDIKAVTTHQRREILDDNPEDIGALFVG